MRFHPTTGPHPQLLHPPHSLYQEAHCSTVGSFRSRAVATPDPFLQCPPAPEAQEPRQTRTTHWIDSLYNSRFMLSRWTTSPYRERNNTQHLQPSFHTLFQNLMRTTSARAQDNRRNSHMRLFGSRPLTACFKLVVRTAGKQRRWFARQRLPIFVKQLQPRVEHNVPRELLYELEAVVAITL